MSEHQWRSGGSITPPEVQLLDLIREGKVDAEIAVRLGISNAEVKDRTSRLANKLGAKDKAGLRDRAAPSSLATSAQGDSTAELRKALLRWRIVAIAMTAVAVALGVFLVLGRDSGEDATGANANATEIPSAVATRSPSALASLTPTPLPSPTLIAGREMYDAGQLFVQRLGPNPISPSNRESLIVVDFGGPAVIRYAGGPVTWRLQGSGPQSLYLSGSVGGLNVRLLMQAQGQTQFLFGDDDSVGVFSQDDSAPTLVIWVQAPEGPAYYHAEVSSDGHLYIATEGLPAISKFAYDTGESLDSWDYLPAGDTVRADHWVLCDPANRPACESVLRGDFIPLAPGALTCDAAKGTLTIVFQGELRATFVFTSGQSQPSFQCKEGSRPVAAGEPLGYPGVWVVSATWKDGAPISVVTTRNGVVYVSHDLPTVGCPCREGT